MSEPYWVPLGAAPVVAPVVSYGTTLPASPVDGQEAVLVDSLTNPKHSWRFRYNAGSTSAYKWEFVGGNPVHNGIDVGAGTSMKSFQRIAGTAWWTIISGANGLWVTVPRPGEYHVSGVISYGNNSEGTFAEVTGFNGYDGSGTLSASPTTKKYPVDTASQVFNVPWAGIVVASTANRVIGLCGATAEAGGTRVFAYTQYVTVVPQRVS